MVRADGAGVNVPVSTNPLACAIRKPGWTPPLSRTMTSAICSGKLLVCAAAAAGVQRTSTAIVATRVCLLLMVVFLIRSSLRVQEQGRLLHEGVVELKERAMPGVGVRQQYRVRQMFSQHIRVSDRNHGVADPVHHEAWLSDPAELGEAFAIHPLPRTKRDDLGLRDLRAGDRLTILAARGESRHEGLAGRLARLARGEEEFHQHLVAVETGIFEDLPELRLLQVHDV